MRYEAITGNTWTEIFTTATHGMTAVVHDSIILTQKCRYLVVGTILYINSKLKFILVGFVAAMPVNVKTFRHNPAILRREQSGSKVDLLCRLVLSASARWWKPPIYRRCVARGRHRPLPGYDTDCSRALPGIQRCSSLSALLAEPWIRSSLPPHHFSICPYWRGR